MYNRLLLFGLAATLAACSRTADSTTTPAPAAAPLLLSSVYEVNGNSPVLDTIARTQFRYDNAGRPAEWTYTEYDSVTGAAGYSQHFVYYYRTAQDSLAYYSTSTSRNAPNTLAETMHKYYTWSNGLLAQDSARSDIYYYNEYKTRYTRTPGLLTFAREGFNYQQDARFFLQHSGSDISHQLDSVNTLIYSAGLGQMRNEYTTTYLAQANPFYVLARPVYEDFIFEDWSIDNWFNAPQHLIAQRTQNYRNWTQIPTATSQSTTVYTYQYDNAGRPVEVRSSNGSRARRLLLAYY